MKCLRKYQWVKLPRDIPDMGKGLMAYWAMLASRAAFRKGNASYCGHSNPVAPGMWAGGVVGLKSILGAKSRTKALQILDKLSCLGFLKYSLDSQTKKLTYEITDWVVKCSGAECMSGAVYASTGYGFLCLPRSITQRLADAKRVFDKADAWLDLWCHTTYEDYGNAFSFLAPVVQYGRFGSVLTLETLGERWGWEKTKVWRFFKKHGDVFSLYRLPSSYGCLVFNASYPTGADIQLPEQEIVMRILRKILICSAYKCKYIVLDLSELKGKLLPVGMVIALDYVWDNIKADRVKKKAIMIDEIWQLIGASSNKLAAEFCLEIFKVIRGYGGAAIAATQDLSDFFSLDDGKYGRAIINNSKNKIILNLEQDEAQYVKDVLKLTRTEVRSITQFERGEALIHSNNNKVPVVIKASAEEKEMITTDRAELEAILRKRQKEAT